MSNLTQFPGLKMRPEPPVPHPLPVLFPDASEHGPATVTALCGDFETDIRRATSYHRCAQLADRLSTLITMLQKQEWDACSKRDQIKALPEAWQALVVPQEDR